MFNLFGFKYTNFSHLFGVHDLCLFLDIVILNKNETFFLHEILSSQEALVSILL